MNTEKKIEGFVDAACKKNAFFRLLIRPLRFLGISTFVRKAWLFRNMKKDMYNPTQQMIESKKYFDEHKNDIDYIKQRLADECSIISYDNAIQYRITHDVSYARNYTIKDQYFPKDIIKLSDDEVFIDCGAFTGDTYLKFRKYSHNRFKRIVCFEPDISNFSELVRTVRDDQRVVLFNKGAWDKEDTLCFSENSGTDARILGADESNVFIRVVNLDGIEACNEATFLKMDIEGAEMNALLGAEHLIRNNHPKLAVCIYHSDEDFIRLLRWIDNLNMGYKFYVRCHSFDINETVLYAI